MYGKSSKSRVERKDGTDMYTTPKMKFEEITFFEKVATDGVRCWEASKVYFDYPDDGVKGAKEYSIEAGHCNNSNNSYNTILNAIFGTGNNKNDYLKNYEPEKRTEVINSSGMPGFSTVASC